MPDFFNKIMGRTRYVVCRIFLHLAVSDMTPILGELNRIGREAIATDGDLQVMGGGLVDLCETLLRYDEYWLSAANEGDIFWNEGEAGDYVNDLFTDTAARYGADLDFNSNLYQPLFIPTTNNLVVTITVAYEGEVPDLETDLANMQALKNGLKALIKLHYNSQFRAIQVNFSPARLGEELTDDQILQYYPELVSLKTRLKPSIPSPQVISQAIEVFFSYHPQDEELLKTLEKHLTILQRDQVIKTWHEGRIEVGQERQYEINKYFNTSQLILLLISADYLASDNCYSTVEAAMQRHRTGEARVIPVILRPVDYQGALFAQLQPLPKNAQPVTLWTNLDAAFANIAIEIRKVVEKLVEEQ